MQRDEFLLMRFRADAHYWQPPPGMKSAEMSASRRNDRQCGDGYSYKNSTQPNNIWPCGAA
jgi:hypothetical protein